MKHPRMIGQYQIVERLASGGAGEIYMGIDTKVDREVAIKFLRPELASDSSYVDRFVAEAKSLGRLNHPNIATLYALPQEDDYVCMVMELVRGHTVEQIINDRRGPLGVKESLALIAQVADGLSYAHQKGVIHRDIKPSNLMVTDSGRVKIMDFGIAQGSTRLTSAGYAVGTPLYMSPEQHRGLEGDERSDIYSLAIVLYELLAGTPPFKGTAAFELAKAHLEQTPPPLIPRIAGVEPELEAAIMTALSKRPEQRFPSISAFSNATGATALRGEATQIIHSHTRLVQGADEPQKTPQVPFQTLALAVVRSRAGTIMRRFRSLHPAVQAASVTALVAATAGGLWSLNQPVPDSMTAEVQEGGNISSPPAPPAGGEAQKTIPSGRNVFVKYPPDAAPTRATADNVPPSPSGCPPQFIKCLTDNPDNQTKGFQPPVAETNPAFNRDGSPPQERTLTAKAEPGESAGSAAHDYDEGLIYLQGKGVPEDDAMAKYLFNKAANAPVPYPKAMLRLGYMYYDGKGGEKNLGSARYWFERAADKGEGEALYNLGAMCENNEAGLHHRDAKAYYERAFEQGYQLAKNRLEKFH